MQLLSLKREKRKVVGRCYKRAGKPSWRTGRFEVLEQLTVSVSN